MPEPKRAVRPEPLEVASDRMAELLRRADDLLLEWSSFGASVRAQVEREAAQLGDVVVDATEVAVRRAAAEGTSRAIADQLGKQLGALAAEVGKLETRARAATRALGEQRRGDRRLLYGLAGALLVANGLLVVLLIRNPPPVIAAVPSAPAIAPTPVERPVERAPEPQPGRIVGPGVGSDRQPSAPSAEGSGSAAIPTAPVTSPPGPSAEPKPAKPTPAPARSAKVRHGPPAGARPPVGAGSR